MKDSPPAPRKTAAEAKPTKRCAFFYTEDAESAKIYHSVNSIDSAHSVVRLFLPHFDAIALVGRSGESTELPQFLSFVSRLVRLAALAWRKERLLTVTCIQVEAVRAGRARQVAIAIRFFVKQD